MPLTNEDLQILARPFPAEEHEFLNGLTYITEGAITDRIEEVDPCWEFRISSIATRGNTAIIMGQLTIKGITRENTGMAQVMTTKDGNREANEAEKSATTDALKRAARLFGVGRYLLALPKSVTDVKSMAVHLKKIQNEPIEVEQDNRPSWWNEVYRQMIAHPYFHGVTDHLLNAMKKVQAEKQIARNASVESVLHLMNTLYDGKEAEKRKIS